MPKEFKTLFRLIREGQISDREAFQLAWAIFVAMTGYRPKDEEPEREEQRIIEVKGFAGGMNKEE